MNVVAALWPLFVTVNVTLVLTGVSYGICTFSWVGETYHRGAGTPLIVTVTPPSCGGSGGPAAGSAVDASCDPIIVRIMPGAYTCRYDAPLPIAVIEGAGVLPEE